MNIKPMEEVIISLVALRILISIIGIFGNLFLILAIFQVKQLKTYEIFLIGLTASNLEEIVVVDIYDIYMRYKSSVSIWLCQTLKFWTIIGQVGSILFTLVISIYRYQKLRDTDTRLNLPIHMDKIRVAMGLCVFCGFLAALFAVPTYVLKLDGHLENSTTRRCPPDFFLCSKTNCPTVNRVYKFLFIVICNLLPLIIVTGTSMLILKVLIVQQRVIAVLQGRGSVITNRQRPRNKGLHRSTVAVLVAMAVFQVDWILYLVLHLAFEPNSFSAWSEVEFFITTSYTAISPYIYGIGSNLFSLKHFMN
ncbi:apelin receptor [Chanos chanos]|uniref:Apelin receptor n=1 Tax=Chanos chanos TaxID=29144 RepID=A0A6J2V8A8_CHACN|nr:apelin receptor-like [Chanos chanos]